MTHDTTFHKAIHEALKAIALILQTATSDVQQSVEYIARGEQNTAIGTLLGFDESLERASSLYKAILAMHRIGK
jgi:hypothetical protein